MGGPGEQRWLSEPVLFFLMLCKYSLTFSLVPLNKDNTKTLQSVPSKALLSTTMSFLWLL